MKIKTAILAAIFVTGCATSTDGVVNIGPDTYMLGGLGRFTDYSSSAVKARMFKEAHQFCADKGREMVPVNSTGQDSGYGTYASAEIQFKCREK